MKFGKTLAFATAAVVALLPIKAEATSYLALEPFSGGGYVVPPSSSDFEFRALGAVTSQVGKTAFRIYNPNGIALTFEWFEGAGYTKEIQSTVAVVGSYQYVTAPTGKSLYNKLKVKKENSVTAGSIDVAFFEDASQDGRYSEFEKISETRTLVWRALTGITAELAPVYVGDEYLEAKVSLPAVYNIEQTNFDGMTFSSFVLEEGQSAYTPELSTLESLSRNQNQSGTAPNTLGASLKVSPVLAGSKHKITVAIDGVLANSAPASALASVPSNSTKTLIGGVYRKDVILTKKQSPYLITRTIEIPVGVTFRIEPDVTIYTSSQNIGTAFRVAGRLDLAGSEGHEILLLANNKWQPYQWIYQEKGILRANHVAVSGGNSFNSGWGIVEKITNSEFVNMSGGISDLGSGSAIGDFITGANISGNIFQNSKLEVNGRFTNVSKNLFHGSSSVLSIPRWASIDSDRNNISENTILGNVEVYGEGQSGWTVNSCCSYHQFNGRPVNLENNYWGPGDESAIRDRVIDKNHPSSSISFQGVGDIVPFLASPADSTPVLDDKILPLQISAPEINYPVIDAIQETATITWISLDDDLILDYELEYRTSDNKGWGPWTQKGIYATPQSVVISMIDRGQIQVRVIANSDYGIVSSTTVGAGINRSPGIYNWNVKSGESSIDGVRLAWVDYHKNWSGGVGDSLVWEITYRQLGVPNAPWATTVATSGETAEDQSAKQNSIWINKLKPSAAYEFKTRAIRNGVKGFWSDPWIRYTKGAKDRFVKITDASGQPMANVSVKWSTTQDYWNEKTELGKQAQGKTVTNSNGVAALRRLPAGQYALRLQGTLSDGTTFLTKQLVAISAVDLTISMPEPPKMKKVSVYVETPSGMPIAGAIVSLVDKWEQKSLDLNSTLREPSDNGDPSFEADEYYAIGNWIFRGQGASESLVKSDENGKATFYGFIADETIAKAKHEGLSFREVSFAKVIGGLAAITMDYVPWVEAIPESIEVVSPGQLIAVPVSLRPDSLGDTESVFDDLVAEADRIRVSIEPPAGVINKCAVSSSRTVTSGYLDTNGNLTLQICPSSTGVWTIKTGGVAGGDLIALYVNGTAPSSDFEVSLVKSETLVSADWGTPTKLTGATEVKFTTTLYEVKAGKRYKLASVLTLFNSSTFLTSKYKGKVLQVGVVASTKFGKSLENFSATTSIIK